MNVRLHSSHSKTAPPEQKLLSNCLFYFKLISTRVAVHVHFKICFLAKFLQAHMAPVVFSCPYLIHLENNQEKTQ
jgi:hypothetical protein